MPLNISMALVDRMKETVSRAFPKKNEDEPIDTSHLGYGNSLERPFDDDVRFLNLFCVHLSDGNVNLDDHFETSDCLSYN